MTDLLAIDLAALAHVFGGARTPPEPLQQPPQRPACFYDPERKLTTCPPAPRKPPPRKAIDGGDADDSGGEL
jgi:hypothetical protein